MDIDDIYRELLVRGFARVSIGGEIVGELENVVRQFYAMSVSQRLKLGVWKTGGFLGYSPSEWELNEEGTAVANDVPMFSDARRRGYSSFDFVGDESVFDGSGLELRNQWPSDARFVDRCQRIYFKMSECATGVSRALLGKVIEDCGGSCFETKCFEERGCSLMRLLRYPVVGEELFSKEHNDYEFVSFVFEDGDGLEILNDDGSWEAVRQVHGSLIVIPGDMLELASGGVVRSRLHRVRFGLQERRAVIFFQGLPFNIGLPARRGLTVGVFGHHICGLLIRGTPHLATSLEEGELELPYPVPRQNPFKR